MTKTTFPQEPLRRTVGGVACVGTLTLTQETVVMVLSERKV